MKRYIKNGDIKFAKDIVVKSVSPKGTRMQVLNPTEEMILADGWIEYVVPELTDEEKLERAKGFLKNRITEYDSSRNVNEFSIGETNLWLDKATRAGLMLRFQAETATDKENTILWYENQQFPLSLTTAMQMLYALELYASACYDNTQRHLATISNLETIDEVESYDFTVGYPDKLKF